MSSNTFFTRQTENNRCGLERVYAAYPSVRGWAKELSKQGMPPDHDSSLQLFTKREHNSTYTVIKRTSTRLTTSIVSGNTIIEPTNFGVCQDFECFRTRERHASFQY